MKMKYIQTVKVIDPDSNGEVDIAIYKEEAGGMVGLDESYMLQVDDAPLSPYGNGELEEDEYPGAMSYDKWFDKYHPVMDEDGIIILDLCSSDVHDMIGVLSYQYIWTQFDDDHIESGYHFVNRLGYIVTAIPYKDSEKITVKPPESNND